MSLYWSDSANSAAGARRPPRDETAGKARSQLVEFVSLSVLVLEPITLRGLLGARTCSIASNLIPKRQSSHRTPMA